PTTGTLERTCATRNVGGSEIDTTRSTRCRPGTRQNHSRDHRGPQNHQSLRSIPDGTQRSIPVLLEAEGGSPNAHQGSKTRCRSAERSSPVVGRGRLHCRQNGDARIVESINGTRRTHSSGHWTRSYGREHRAMWPSLQWSWHDRYRSRRRT